MCIEGYVVYRQGRGVMNGVVLGVRGAVSEMFECGKLGIDHRSSIVLLHQITSRVFEVSFWVLILMSRHSRWKEKFVKNHKRITVLQWLSQRNIIRDIILHILKCLNICKPLCHVSWGCELFSYNNFEKLHDTRKTIRSFLQDLLSLSDVCER